MAARTTVVLCTHNGAAFIKDQLASIFRQTLPPAELIISDDASTDGTLHIVEDFLRNMAGSITPTVTSIIVNPSPLGVVQNFSQAIHKATGDYIALCDQDDIWRNDKLEVLCSILDNKPDVMLVHSDAQLVDQSGEPMGNSLFRALRIARVDLLKERTHGGFALLMKRNVVTGATALFRKSLLSVAFPFPEFWLHDEWLAVMAAAVGEIDFVDHELIDYRQHGGNQVGATALNFRGRISRLTTTNDNRDVRLLKRARALVDRLNELAERIEPTRKAFAEEKLAHEIVRSSLLPRRSRRVCPVVTETKTGRYETCGLGMQDILRDLVQPKNNRAQEQSA